MIPQNAAILLFDNCSTTLEKLSIQFYKSGFKQVYSICDNTKLIPFLTKFPVSAIIFSLSSSDSAGKILLSEMMHTFPFVSLIVISESNSHKTAVECMKTGAYDYLVNPEAEEIIQSTISCMLNKTQHASSVMPHHLGHNAYHRDTHHAFSEIITQNRKMLSIFRYMEIIAPTSQAVMVTGETGTGKELIARGLHLASARQGHFVSINVAGLDDIMFSDTLFGHASGAYTGANHPRKGLIEKAENGTLFLDEIGDLSNASQIKLLRLLQEGEYYPLGSDTLKITNTRIIVATNCLLEQKISTGEFRNDLYYRLCAHHIHLPPLRERRNDIMVLTEYFVREAASNFGVRTPIIPPDVLDQLSKYNFPGNIRELKGLISRASALSSDGVLSLPKLKQNQAVSPLPTYNPSDIIVLSRMHGRFPTLQEAEFCLIREALHSSGGNQRTAALMLGISKQALNKRLQRNPEYLQDLKGLT